ncbi:MBL fold metallo-hydrolase [Micrococcus luteus]|nr:MBL fold metallo-hydrolase [Micrococcus luteus]MCV7734965.1 MBL fold metallo-hydrolase [Micrococcus luteus]
MSTGLRGTQVITLGTAGGPRWWRHGGGTPRAGISTAVVVGGAVYLIDCGYGAGRQLVRAGYGLDDVEAVFLTHLHSDHIVDLTAIALFSTFEITQDDRDAIRLIGPGDRGALYPTSPHTTAAPTPLTPHDPTPGTAETLRRIVAAHATDLNERILDSLRPSPLDRIHAHDIVLPSNIAFDPDAEQPPAMDPFVVFEDSRVRVSAILVEHPPVAPAYGYRFDTDEGSVVVSGDTAATDNMRRLADRASLLLHEAIDLDWLVAKFPDPESPQAHAIRSHHERAHTSVADALRIADDAAVGSLALHHLVPGTSGASLGRQLEGRHPFSSTVPSDLQVIPLASR